MCRGLPPLKSLPQPPGFGDPGGCRAGAEGSHFSAFRRINEASKALMMSMDILTALISLAGVITSIAISYLVSNRQIRVQIESMRYQLAQSYTEKLYLRRLDAYPCLYEIISDFAKRIRLEDVSLNDIRAFAETVSAWDSKYALLASAFTVRQLMALHKALREMEASREETFSREMLHQRLFPLILELELAMKTELGVFASDGYHSPVEVKPLNTVLDSLRNTSKGRSATESP
jgi:hypothetical protein